MLNLCVMSSTLSVKCYKLCIAIVFVLKAGNTCMYVFLNLYDADTPLGNGLTLLPLEVGKPKDLSAVTQWRFITSSFESFVKAFLYHKFRKILDY